ncbi:MAG: hypothetical protein SFV15_06065 [Polyangiaceae bacterium]|nr:hypothetical protein [Polyangiaceae bacterium]
MRIILMVTITALAACNPGEPSGKAPPVVKAELSQPAPAEPTRPATSNAAVKASQLTHVEDVSQVCMVNNTFMGRKQIPVVVEGKTYFGCCEMCKGRLARDATARVAKDPVSGKDVDKATAVIAKREDGQILYFENKETLARYRAL